MTLLFWAIPLFFLTLNPSIWIDKFTISREYDRGSKVGFITAQFFRLILGCIYAGILNYFILIDHTLFAFLLFVPWIVAIWLIIDGTHYDSSRMTNVGAIILAIIVIFSMVYPLTITQNLYGLVKAKVSTERLEPMDIKHIVVVPVETATNKGSKLMGQLTNYSYYRVGGYTIQKLNNELYWVAPVEYQGFFTSQKAEQITGYVKVSAEDPNRDAELVTKFSMQYVPSAYFSEDLKRLVHNKYNNVIILEASFEPNEDGKPYYAATYGHYNNFRSGVVVDGVILVDPSDGSMVKYKLDNMPEFVDQVIPADVAEKYNEWYGHYQHGLLNTFFGKKDYHDPTKWGNGKEVMGVFGPDNRMYWFTDHTTSKSNSMVGYSLMDGRSGVFTYYTGASGFYNGKAAMDIVDKSFQKDQWKAASPILYNIYGEDTWVVPVVDSNGILRQIATVHAQTGKIAYGVNKQAVFDNYKTLLATEKINGNTSPTTTQILDNKEGVVKRISSISTQNGDNYMILLENDDAIYSVNSLLMPYVVFVEKGDNVKLGIINTDEKTVTVKEFYNVSLNTPKK